jgi:hypothetical protein
MSESVLAARVKLEAIIQMLLCQPFADRFQFPSAMCGCLRICHLKVIERIKNNLRDDQPGILLVIGGNDVPMRMVGTCRVEALLISLHVLLPVFPLVNVRQAEFPVLVGHIDTLEKPLSLFVLRKVEEELE